MKPKQRSPRQMYTVRRTRLVETVDCFSVLAHSAEDAEQAIRDDTDGNQYVPYATDTEDQDPQYAVFARG